MEKEHVMATSQWDRWQSARDTFKRVFPILSGYADRTTLGLDPTCGTACTNGSKIDADPKFLAELTTPEVNFLYLHEVYHVMHQHMTRIPEDIKQEMQKPTQERDNALLVAKFAILNVAQDVAIHNELEGELQGNTEYLRPKCGQFMPQYSGLPSEEIYHILSNDSSLIQKYKPLDIHCYICPGPKGPDGQDGPPVLITVNADGQIVQSQPLTQQQADQLQQIARDSQKDCAKNVMGCKSNSRSSKERTAQVRAVKRSKDWTIDLADICHRASQAAYTYLTIDRRAIQRGVIEPGTTAEVAHLIIAVDISPSISPKQLNLFASHVDDIRSQLPELVFHVLWFDDDIRRIQEPVTSHDAIEWSAKQQGGTDFTAIMDWADQHEEEMEAIIILTDMMGGMRTQPPKAPVYWLAPTDHAGGQNTPDFVKYGQVIWIE